MQGQNLGPRFWHSWVLEGMLVSKLIYWDSRHIEENRKEKSFIQSSLHWPHGSTTLAVWLLVNRGKEIKGVLCIISNKWKARRSVSFDMAKDAPKSLYSSRLLSIFAGIIQFNISAPAPWVMMARIRYIVLFHNLSIQLKLHYAGSKYCNLY